MFSICEWLLPESGLPASVAAGVVVGRRPSTQAAQMDELIRELASLAITMLFPLLAADVSWAELSPLGWGGVSCVLVLMVLVRPLAVGVSTMGLPLNWRQRLFMGWLAPRGSSPQLLHPCSRSAGTGGCSRGRPPPGSCVPHHSDDGGIAGSECPTAGQGTWVDAGRS